MINSIGLENIGIPAFASHKLPFLRKFDTRVIVNFSERRKTVCACRGGARYRRSIGP